MHNSTPKAPGSPVCPFFFFFMVDFSVFLFVCFESGVFFLFCVFFFVLQFSIVLMFFFLFNDGVCSVFLNKGYFMLS